MQTQEFRDAEIVRTRDPEVLKDADVVIDVGGVYEPGAPPRRCSRRPVLCGEPIKQSAKLIGEPIKQSAKLIGEPTAAVEPRTLEP